MRTSTLVLSISTAVFATTTAWLAYELHERDAAVQSAGSLAPSATAPAPLSAHATAQTTPMQSKIVSGGVSAENTVSLAPANPERGVAPTPAAAPRDEGMMVYARQFLARYDDSAQRQAMLEEARTGIRRQYARLKEQLGLSDARFEQLATILAEQNLQAQEYWARCTLDPKCDLNNPSRPTVDDRSQELLALIGADDIETFNQYRETLGERDAVAQFRGRLADSQFLPQTQAEQLISALADERKRYMQEAAQRGSRVRGWGTNLGMIMYPEDAGSIEAQMAEAAQYSERLRNRAAALLTPAQLAAYVQMQNELLAQLATFMRPAPRKANSLKLAQGS